MRKYRDFVAEIMNDPAEAAEYLRASLSEYSDGGNLEAFLTAVRSVTEARDGIGRTGIDKKNGI